MLRDDEWAKPHSPRVQYLCAKYSSLIARLKEETAARQRAEQTVQILEERLRQETALRVNADALFAAERAVVGEERRTIRSTYAGVEASDREVEELKHALELTQALTAKADHLRDEVAGEASSPKRSVDYTPAGVEVISRQGKELTQLRREHAGSVLEVAALVDELANCREQLLKWQRAAEAERKLVTELEIRLGVATREKDEAGSKVKQMQSLQYEDAGLLSLKTMEDLRVPSSVGRAAAKCVGTRAKDDIELNIERLALEAKELRARLGEESNRTETARVEAARATAAEVRALAAVGEIEAELQGKAAREAAVQQQAGKLDTELALTRTKLEWSEQERNTSAIQVETLRAELRAAVNEREEARRGCTELREELAETRRLAEAGAAQCRRQLDLSERALSHSQSEVLEERKVRDRCHWEAVRTNERLRMLQHEEVRFRERMRALEDKELRYPSRTREAIRDVGVSNWMTPVKSNVPLRSPSLPPSLASTAMQSPALEPVLGSAGLADSLQFVQEFVAQEEKRLRQLDRSAALQQTAA